MEDRGGEHGRGVAVAHAGDEVVEVESEKINNAVEAPAPGVLRRRVAKEGDVLPVGGLLGVIADASVPDEEIDSYVEEFQATFAPEEEEAGGPEPETVEIGGKNLVLAPVYGPPFVRDQAGGRRYATIADFRNFVKLGQMSKWLHHSGGTICEPSPR